MKSERVMWMIAFAVCAVMVVLASAAPIAAQQERSQSRQVPRYKLTVLPTLGGTFGYAGGINNEGSVVGNSTPPGDAVVHAFLWKGGVMTDLGTLGGPDSITANGWNGINDRRAVTGYSETSTPDPNGEDVCGFGTQFTCLPFAWQKGVMTALPLPGGNNGIAFEVNNRGQIVGTAETPNPDPTCSLFFLQVEPVMWQDGSLQELPLLPSDPDGSASAINDKGQAVGVSGCTGTNTGHAVLWPKGANRGVIDLGNLGGTLNLPADINNKTQVVGQADVPGGTHHAFLWQDGVMSDLGFLPGLPTSFADGINNQGQVIGVSQDANGDDFSSVPFLWQNGVITDLNSLIPAGSPLLLQEPESINDHGQIVGFGLLSDGEQRGFLLTPCDEKDPGSEGCDDSMLEARPIASLQARVRATSGSPLPTALWQRRTRIHLPGSLIRQTN